MDILAEVRKLTHTAHRTAVDRLPRALRLIAGYHIGWWDADGAPCDIGAGKAVRPALTLACAALAGGPQAVPDAIPAAVAVELVHDFSLLHDDVMDRDTTRRGRPAAWTVFGADQALLAGTALLTVAMGQAGRVSARAQTVLCDTVLEMCDGQSMDLQPGPDRGLSRRLVVAQRKTGALFGAACELGAVAANSPSPQAAWCRAFGRDLGTAFQLADDLADGWPGPQSARDQGRGEARRRVAAALSHLDAAAGSAAAEDLRLLASAVLTESVAGGGFPEAHVFRKRTHTGTHTAEPTE
jgi:geranylgeranyl diphosphate synthase, type I